MELPDPHSYEIEPYPDGVDYRCVSCKRPEEAIRGNVDKHIMGCAFRTRWWAIWHYNQEQARQAAILRIETALRKMDGDDVLR